MHPNLRLPTHGSGLIDRREAISRLAGVLGGVFSAPTVAALLSACEDSGAAASAGAAAALTGDQKEMLATIADQIIPRTDTPGARDVGVHEWIATMMEKYYPPDDRQRFLAGLANVDELARAAHGSRFRQCTPEQQAALLTALDRETMRAAPPAPRPSPAEVRERTEPGTRGTPLPPEVATDSDAWRLEQPTPRRVGAPPVPFWRTMKELTLVGYYTSEPGATKELRYDPSPGHYEACVPLSQIGRAWAV